MTEATTNVNPNVSGYMLNGTPLDNESLDSLFNQARTHSIWSDKLVSDEIVRQLYDLMKMAPTSFNMCPARFIFVKSQEGKERLKPHLVPGNLEKTMSAPLCVVIGYDLEFWKHLPRLFPYKDVRSMFNQDKVYTEYSAFRNGSLQGAYLILAARAVGLDCGPMAGFDNRGIDQEFFSGTSIKSNFLCNLGYGLGKNLSPRAPRFDFEEVCKIL